MQNLLDKIKSHPRATFLVAGIVTLVVAGVVILVMIVSLNNTIKQPVVTPDEQKMVLSEVIKNNPKDLINSGTTTSKGSTSSPTPAQTPIPVTPVVTPTPTTPTEPTAPANPVEAPVAPDLNEYNYRVTKTSYVKGPAFDACTTYRDGMGGSGDRDSTTEYTEYFERYLSVNKTIIKEGNNTSNYSIYKYGRDISSSLNYLYGDYAVNNIYKPYPQFDNQRDSNVISYPTADLDTLLHNYFGSNAVIFDVQVDSAGNKTYMIKSSYSSYCSASYIPYFETDLPVPPQKTLIDVYKVDAKTFTITEVKRYLEEINDSNLITTTTTQTQRLKVAYSQVQSQFVLDSNVTVKVNDLTTSTYKYDPYNDLINKVNFLAGKGISILLPSKPDLLSYFSVSDYKDPEQPDNYAYLKDRNYYPNTAWGTELYNRYNIPYTPENDYYLSMYDENQKYYTFEKYKAEKQLSDLVSAKVAALSTSTTVEDRFIDVANVKIAAKKITKIYKYNYPTSYTVSYPTSYSQNLNTSYETTYLFEYMGSAYALSYSQYQNNNINFDEKNFVVYLPSDNAAAQDKLIQMLYDYNAKFVYPVSYPPSYPTSYTSI